MKTTVSETADTSISMQTLIKDENDTYVKMWTNITSSTENDTYVRMDTVITAIADTDIAMRTVVADTNDTDVSMHTHIGNTTDTLVSMKTIITDGNATNVSMRTVIPSGRDDVYVSMRTYIYEGVDPDKVKVMWDDKHLIGYAGKANRWKMRVFNNGNLVLDQPEELGEYKAYLLSYDVPQYQEDCIIDLRAGYLEVEPDFGGDFKIQIVWHDKINDKEYVVDEKYVFVKGVNPYTQYNV
jgi:hypothetical protein